MPCRDPDARDSGSGPSRRSPSPDLRARQTHQAIDRQPDPATGVDRVPRRAVDHRAAFGRERSTRGRSGQTAAPRATDNVPSTDRLVAALPVAIGSAREVGRLHRDRAGPAGLPPSIDPAGRNSATAGPGSPPAASSHARGQSTAVDHGQLIGVGTTIADPASRGADLGQETALRGRAAPDPASIARRESREAGARRSTGHSVVGRPRGVRRTDSALVHLVRVLDPRARRGASQSPRARSYWRKGRSWSPGGARSRRPSPPDGRRSGFSSSRSGARRWSASSSTRRASGSRSSRSRAAR